MERYQGYKDSGVAWLGEIPEHWEVKKIKFFVKKIGSGITPKGGSTVYQLTGIPLLRSQNIHFDGLKLDDVAYITLKTHKEMSNSAVLSGDVLLNITGGSIGRCFYVDQELGEANVNQHVCIIRPQEQISTKFLYYFLRSDLGQNQIDIEQTRSGREGLNFEVLKNFIIPYICLKEQKAIANFLDRKTAEIDRLIAQKQRLIELYEQEKNALINHAVTKGINPNVKLKPCGIKWLRDIPEHWETIALKRVAKTDYKSFTDGDWIETPYITEFGVRLIQTGNIGIGKYKEKGFRYIAEETLKELNCTEIFPNDVLVCRLDGPVGRACLVPELDSRMITSVDNTIIKVSNRFDARFIVYLMSSDLWIEWIQALIRVGGGFRFRISRSILGEQIITFPPTEEQKAISEYIEIEITRIDAKIAKTKKIIELQKEYRTALISEAITGKIKVPELVD